MMTGTVDVFASKEVETRQAWTIEGNGIKAYSMMLFWELVHGTMPRLQNGDKFQIFHWLHSNKFALNTHFKI